MYWGLTVVDDSWWKILDSCTQKVPATRASRDRGPKREEGIFSPTPKTEEGGASPSQYVGPAALSLSATPDIAKNIYQR